MGPYRSSSTMAVLLFAIFTLSTALDMSIISYDDKNIVGESKSSWRTDEEVMSIYEGWLAKHGKAYNGLGEKERRFQIFKDNLRYIDDHNAKNLSYKLGLNRFADLSNDEYRSTFLGTKTRAQNRRLSNWKGSVGDDVFADRKAHAGAETKRRSDGTGDDSVSAHDLGSRTAQSPCHSGNASSFSLLRLSGDYDGEQCKNGQHFKINVSHSQGLPKSLQDQAAQNLSPGPASGPSLATTRIRSRRQSFFPVSITPTRTTHSFRSKDIVLSPDRTLRTHLPTQTHRPDPETTPLC